MAEQGADALRVDTLPPGIRVKYFRRKQSGPEYSLERVFDTICGALPPDTFAKEWVCRFRSRGFLRRLLNLFEAPFHQGDINHITGDVHYIALLLAKRRTILTIHDCVSLHFATGLTYARILWLWYRLPVLRVAAITAVSEFSKKELIHYVDCDPHLVHVIPNPVPTGFVAWPKVFNSRVPVLLQVGTGERNKNICRVAEALRGIPCSLDIVGSLSDRQRRTLESNSVSYTQHWGLSDGEVVERYRKCDIVVFASTYEGFGMPIIEGNATGRPVVTSNIGSMPEVAGSAASLVDPFDCSSIRKGILRVIDDANYRSHLVAQGFENVKRFQPNLIAAQYADLYREVFLRCSEPLPAVHDRNGAQSFRE
jgi:glycosyltransferase involved in cell wall biosynthesis